MSPQSSLARKEAVKLFPNIAIAEFRAKTIPPFLAIRVRRMK
jgi:hypothetical protein